MPRLSAGLLMYRFLEGELQVFLAHPGGPFDTRKDDGYWTAVKQKGGIIVHAWAFAGDWEGKIVSNAFAMEGPPKSGKQTEFPEIDRAEFFDVPAAKQKVKAAQAALIEELERVVKK